MTVVPAAVEEADAAAELDRIAWNLPRRPLTEVPRTWPVPQPEAERLQADEAAVQGLDWQGFLSRYFPERRRHDLEALTAYGAYKSSNGAERPPGEVVRLVRPDPMPPESTAADTWADDGGTTR